MDEDRDLVTIRTFETELDAHLVRNILNEQGVPAVVAGSTSFDGMIDSAIQLNVRRIELEKAEEILKEFESEQPDLIPEWTCVCGETVDEGFVTCWNCGRHHPDFSGDDEEE